MLPPQTKKNKQYIHTILYGKQSLVRARSCLARRPCVHKAVQSCARSCAQPCAPALCAQLRTVVRVHSICCAQKSGAQGLCAHILQALTAVHKYKDLCAPHCASIGNSVHNLFSSGTMFWSYAVLFLIVLFFYAI